MSSRLSFISSRFHSCRGSLLWRSLKWTLSDLNVLGATMGQSFLCCAAFPTVFVMWMQSLIPKTMFIINEWGYRPLTINSYTSVNGIILTWSAENIKVAFYGNFGMKLSFVTYIQILLQLLSNWLLYTKHFLFGCKFVLTFKPSRWLCSTKRKMLLYVFIQ